MYAVENQRSVDKNVDVTPNLTLVIQDIVPDSRVLRKDLFQGRPNRFSLHFDRRAIEEVSKMRSKVNRWDKAPPATERETPLTSIGVDLRWFAKKTPSIRGVIRSEW
jgi:hypothetical protein